MKNSEPGTLNPEPKIFWDRKILLTVGGTREAIDPVRFISNHSSGKWGFAVAEMASKRGAEVTVVSGVTTVEPPSDVKVIVGISAEEMHSAVMKELGGKNGFHRRGGSGGLPTKKYSRRKNKERKERFDQLGA